MTDLTGTLKLAATVLAVLLTAGAFAAPVSVAAEHEFLVTEGAGHLEGEAIEGEHELKLGGATFKCAASSFRGTTGAEADAISLEPEYSGCRFVPFPSFPVQVTNSGCKWVFDSDTAANPSTEGVEDAAASLDCGMTGSITVKIATFCTIHIGDTHPGEAAVNQNLHGVKYTGAGSGPTADVVVEAGIHEIAYEATDAACGILSIAKGTQTDGIYLGKTTVRAFEDVSQHTFFATSEGPTSLTGERIGLQHTFRLGGAVVTCGAVTVVGTQVGAEVDESRLTLGYGECTANGSAAEVVNDGCSYRLDSDTFSSVHWPWTNAPVSLECFHSGRFTLKASGCTIDLSDTDSGFTVNQFLPGARYAKAGTPPKEERLIDFRLATIHYVATTDACATAFGVSKGTHSGGLYAGKVLLKGFEDLGPQEEGAQVGIGTENADQLGIHLQ